MEGEHEEGAAAAVPNGLGGEDYVVVKSGDEDGAVDAVATDGGDHEDLAAGEPAAGSETAPAAPEEPARAPTKVRWSPNYCSVALFDACCCIAGG
jgi:hypothetical protein